LLPLLLALLLAKLELLSRAPFCRALEY